MRKICCYFFLSLSLSLLVTKIANRCPLSLSILRAKFLPLLLANAKNKDKTHREEEKSSIRSNSDVFFSLSSCARARVGKRSSRRFWIFFRFFFCASFFLTNTQTHKTHKRFEKRKKERKRSTHQSWTNPGKSSNATPSCSARGSRSFARPRTFSARFKHRNIKERHKFRAKSRTMLRRMR